MKKVYFLSVIVLLVFAVPFLNCNKDDKKDAKAEACNHFCSLCWEDMEYDSRSECVSECNAEADFSADDIACIMDSETCDDIFYDCIGVKETRIMDKTIKPWTGKR